MASYRDVVVLVSHAGCAVPLVDGVGEVVRNIRLT